LVSALASGAFNPLTDSETPASGPIQLFPAQALQDSSNAIPVAHIPAETTDPLTHNVPSLKPSRHVYGIVAAAAVVAALVIGYVVVSSRDSGAANATQTVKNGTP